MQFLISPAFFPCHDPGMSGAKRGCRRKTPSPRDWQKINIKCLFLCTNSCRILSVSLDSLKKKYIGWKSPPRKYFECGHVLSKCCSPPSGNTDIAMGQRSKHIPDGIIRHRMFLFRMYGFLLYFIFTFRSNAYRIFEKR